MKFSHLPSSVDSNHITDEPLSFDKKKFFKLMVLLVFLKCFLFFPSLFSDGGIFILLF